MLAKLIKLHGLDNADPFFICQGARCQIRL